MPSTPDHVGTDLLLPYRFGRVEVGPVERELLTDGEPAAVGARAFELLPMLIERFIDVARKNSLGVR